MMTLEQLKIAAQAAGLMFYEYQSEMWSPYRDTDAIVITPADHEALSYSWGGSKFSSPARENFIGSEWDFRAAPKFRLDITELTKVWWDAHYKGRGRTITVYRLQISPTGVYRPVSYNFAQGIPGAIIFDGGERHRVRAFVPWNAVNPADKLFDGLIWEKQKSFKSERLERLSSLLEQLNKQTPSDNLTEAWLIAEELKELARVQGKE